MVQKHSELWAYGAGKLGEVKLPVGVVRSPPQPVVWIGVDAGFATPVQFFFFSFTQKILRVPNQNGVSQACYIVDIHPSGREPSNVKQRFDTQRRVKPELFTPKYFIVLFLFVFCFAFCCCFLLLLFCCYLLYRDWNSVHVIQQYAHHLNTDWIFAI